jgi:CubicO group peptidase (beta-lactamase class C family)
MVPRPTQLTEQPAFIDAAEALAMTLDSAISGSIDAGWPVENVSFSLAFVTLDQPDRAIPAWEYHHLSPRNVNGTADLTRDSQYLIGSISKVISDYILLRSGVDPDAIITDFIPELKDERSLVKWDNITLRQLASHTAGIPPNCT